MFLTKFTQQTTLTTSKELSGYIILAWIVLMISYIYQKLENKIMVY